MPEPLEEGSVDLADIETETLTGRDKYNWDAVKVAINANKVYVFGMDAKKNSVLAGLRREEINAKLGKVKGSDQFVAIPLPT
jgi:hypothetical protein